MLVTIWRHGEAGAAPRDEDRPLTERGALSVAMAGRSFAAWLTEEGHPSVSDIRFSPLLRTTQTAELLGRALAVAPEACPALAPGTLIDQPRDFLAPGGGHIVLVSHQPFVSHVIWHWLDDDQLEPLLPGGWATLDVLAPNRGGATLIAARTNVL